MLIPYGMKRKRQTDWHSHTIRCAYNWAHFMKYVAVRIVGDVRSLLHEDSSFLKITERRRKTWRKWEIITIATTITAHTNYMVHDVPADGTHSTATYQHSASYSNGLRYDCNCKSMFELVVEFGRMRKRRQQSNVKLLTVGSWNALCIRFTCKTH